MNKKVKKLFSVLLSFVIVSTLGVASFGAKKTENFEIFNDVFYTKIPENFVIYYNAENYCFLKDNSFDTHYIKFRFEENKDNTDIYLLLASSQMNPEKEFAKKVIEDLYSSDYCKYTDIETEIEIISKNGPYIEVECKADYGDGEPCETEIYIFTTKKYIFTVYAESVVEIPEDDVEYVLGNLCINDEYFDKRISADRIDFTDAPAYKDALAKDIENSENEEDLISGTKMSFDDEELQKYMKALMILSLVFIVPFTVIFVVTIIFIVKYIKKKKKLKEYEAKYGTLI